MSPRGEGAAPRRRSASPARAAKGSRYRTKRSESAACPKAEKQAPAESTPEDRIASTLRVSLENTRSGLEALATALQRGRWEESLLGWTRVAALLPEQAAWARRHRRTECEAEFEAIAACARSIVGTFEAYAQMLRTLAGTSEVQS
jgi:hypothetical protein